MAIVSISYDCGCGKHMKTVEEAIKHADERIHTVNVAGIVKSSERKVRKVTTASPYVSAGSRSRVRKPAAAPVEVQIEDRVDFSSLRARLQRK